MDELHETVELAEKSDKDINFKELHQTVELEEKSDKDINFKELHQTVELEEESDKDINVKIWRSYGQIGVIFTRHVHFWAQR